MIETQTIPLSPAPSKMESWRGFGEIWTTETYHLCLRRSARVEVDGGNIAVRLPRNQIQFSIRDIVAARTFRLPVPSMTLVFWQGDGHALVSLFCFSRRLQDLFLEEAEFEITDRRIWRTGLEARRDQETYLLQGGSPSSR